MLPDIPPGQTAAPPGGVAHLRVEFPVGEALYNRETPLVVHVSTPWGEVQGTATGTPAPSDPQHYFGRLDPLNLNVLVPKDTKPGSYPLRLSADLFLCSKQAGQCYRRQVEARATVWVGQTGPAISVRLPASLLKPGR